MASRLLKVFAYVLLHYVIIQALNSLLGTPVMHYATALNAVSEEMASTAAFSSKISSSWETVSAYEVCGAPGCQFWHNSSTTLAFDTHR